jgi:hypothetical protein
VENAKFTPAELAALVTEAGSWLRQQREKFLPYGIPLSSVQKMQLEPFFTAEILDRVRIVNLPQIGETMPSPPFFEKLMAAGPLMLPDPAHTAAMPFIDIAVFNSEPTPRVIFHTLVHVTQMVLVGPERVMEGCFQALTASGLWMAVPFEEQAYHLDERYTRNPADIFSVEEEVREWLRSGRYHRD